MIRFIVVSSFFLQDYISFIFLLVFFFVVFSFGVVVVLIFGEDNKGEGEDNACKFKMKSHFQEALV